MQTNYKLNKIKKTKNKTKHDTKLTETRMLLKVSSAYKSKKKQTKICIKSKQH